MTDFRYITKTMRVKTHEHSYKSDVPVQKHIPTSLYS